MRIKIKFVISFVMWGALLVLLATTIIAWSAAGRLLHPERRLIQDYQQEWLSHPAAHGMKIHVARCEGGKVPCLFISPDRNAGPKERGKLLRTQLSQKYSALRPYGETRGILVLLHGRSGRKEDLLPVAERFVAAGFDCVIPDLPAHGDNPINEAHFATASFERDIAADVLADARWYFGDQHSPAGIWGVSMGGAFAIKAVSQSPGIWKAAVIVSSFDTLEGLVEDKLAFLPKPLSDMLDWELGYMTRYRGDLALHDVHPVDWAQHVSTPAMVVHGDRDRVIALQRGKHLFEALHSYEKSWLVVHGANHGNILTTSAPLYASMSEWFMEYVR